MDHLTVSTPGSVTPGAPRRPAHRHRRSAAISGDFDAMGLGLFSPAPPKSESSAPSPHHEDELDKHFNFNNDDDFAAKASDFSFPMAPPPPPAPSSPQKKPVSALNSPIRLGNPGSHRRTRSSSSAYPRRTIFGDSASPAPVSSPGLAPPGLPFAPLPGSVASATNTGTGNTGFTGTGTTGFAGTAGNSGFAGTTGFTGTTPKSGVIDLDEILRAESASTPDDFLASPFVKSSSSMSVLTSSPQCPREDAIVEEEADDDDAVCIDDAASVDEYYLHPPPGEVYSHVSASSSMTSLSKAPPPWSNNSSRDSVKGSPPPSMVHSRRRSQAMATRYQVFYDQSSRISNAMRNSSSESVHLVRTNSQSSALAPPLAAMLAPKDRFLGHSASLPSLKTASPTDRGRVPRFVELRRHSPPMAFRKEIRPPKHHSSSPVSLSSDHTGEVISNSATDITEYDPSVERPDKWADPRRMPSIVVSDTRNSSPSTDDTFQEPEDTLVEKPVTPPPRAVPLSPAASTNTIDVPRRRPGTLAPMRHIKAKSANLEHLASAFEGLQTKEKKKKKRGSKLINWFKRLREEHPNISI
ncbi:hypothetical protein DICA1_C15434 [Diutina catenulata]